MIKLKEKELANCEKQVNINVVELEKLQQKFTSISTADNVKKLEEQLQASLAEKKKYTQQLKDLEGEHFEQGRTIDQVVTTDNF